MKRDAVSSIGPAPGAALKLDWKIRPIGEASDWLEQWETLNAVAWNTPMLAAPMLLPALSAFGIGTERIAVARRGRQVVAMAIVRPRSTWAWETFQPSQLPMSALILAPGEALEPVAQSLLSALPFNVLTLSISQLDSALVPAPGEGRDVHVLLHMLTGAIEMPNGWDDYYASRPSSLRKNLEKRARRAAQEHGEPNLVVMTEVSSVEAYLALYSETEASGWKGQSGTAIRTDDPQGAFYREMLLKSAAAGQARMFVLRFGDRPVAQQIAIERDGVLYLMKTTYDEQYKSLAPGVLQRQHVLKWAAALPEPIRRVEIYGRLNDSQKPFVTSARDVYHATFYRSRAVKSLREKLRVIRGSGDTANIALTDPGVRTSRASPIQSSGSPFTTEAWFDLIERTCFNGLPGKTLDISAGNGGASRLRLRHQPAWWDGTIAGLSNFYTPLLAPTGCPDQWPEVAVELVRRLRQCKGWTELRLQPLEQDAIWITRLSEELRQAGFKHDRYFCFGNWYATVSGEVAQAFLERTLPSQLRNTISRAEQRLMRRGALEIEVRADGFDEETLDQCITDFQSVYGHSWKRSEPFPEFIPELFRVGARSGWLRFGCLRLNGKPIASQIWLTHNSVASIYKLAYDSEYARFSPGSVLSREMFRHAIDVDRVREIDYLVGDDPYKKNWMTHRRSRIGLVVFNHRHPMGLARAAAHYAGRLWKRFANDPETKEGSDYRAP